MGKNEAGMMALDRATLAKIHIAKKELGWSDDMYRDILQTRYKKSSAAQLTRAEAENLISHCQGKGFKVKRRATPAGATGEERFRASTTYERPMARKIVAIWIKLGLAGVVKYSSDVALQSYVKRMSGCANLAWCDDRQLWRMVEGLKKWAQREGVDIDG